MSNPAHSDFQRSFGKMSWVEQPGDPDWTGQPGLWVLGDYDDNEIYNVGLDFIPKDTLESPSISVFPTLTLCVALGKQLFIVGSK